MARANRPVRVVLGIDPGLTRCGYGAVEHGPGGLRALGAGTIHTKPSERLPARLAELQRGFSEVVERFSPHELAVERIFVKFNLASASAALMAAGVVMLEAGCRGLATTEYSPAAVKSAVVGNGAASKKQVRFMVEHLLGETSDDLDPDAADGLAIAICHIHSGKPQAAVAAE